MPSTDAGKPQAETMLEMRSDARRDALSHSLEDYLEAIVDLAGLPDSPVRAVDIAKKLEVSKASVSKAIAALKEKGLVEQPYYGDITLTADGYAYGSMVWQKHQLLYRFLTEVLHIESERANYEACQMEHAISAESFEHWRDYFESIGLGGPVMKQ